MMPRFPALATAALLAMALPNVAAQAGPNELSQFHPNDMTYSDNSTYTVLALPKAMVASLVAPKTLAPVPTDKTRFPKGWPADSHPVLVVGSYVGSIKQAGLNIPNDLMQARIEVPCVDQLNDGKTCFRLPLAEYIGGANGQLLSGTVPALVGSAEGTTLITGSFDPNGAALKPLGGGEFSFEVDALLVPNPVSGPAVGPEAFQFVISNISKTPTTVAGVPPIAAPGFHFFISQPYIANNKKTCIQSVNYFNSTFAQPFFCDSAVTILDSTLQSNGIPKGLAGNYNGVCYSANGQEITFAGQENCATAAQNVDPKAIN